MARAQEGGEEEPTDKQAMKSKTKKVSTEEDEHEVPKKKKRPKIPGGYNTQAKRNAAATNTLLTALGNLGSNDGTCTPQLNAAILLAKQQLGNAGKMFHSAPMILSCIC